MTQSSIRLRCPHCFNHFRADVEVNVKPRIRFRVDAVMGEEE